MKSWPALILVVGSGFAWPAAAEDFHQPATAVEQALDGILKRADRDDDQLDNLLGGRGKPSFRVTVDYTTMLTKPLIAAINTKQKAMLRAECGGRYRKDELCGFDFLPVTCSQDTNDTYLYSTEASDEDRAEISYTWPGQNKALASYRLIRQAGIWKIDGIRCVSDHDFHFN